jgi:RNA polymerase sigma-70 factor (ECF subfamily)
VGSDKDAEVFEEHRSHLRSVAYRMLGSLSEADDAVQETWLRFNGADTSGVENPGGWLTTTISRICLNMLRARKKRQEQPLEIHLPDPIVTPGDGADPEHEAVLTESVGLALLVVLDTLEPAERLAFVLHDLFAVPFEEISKIVDRSPDAARQLASRARRRVQAAGPAPETDPARRRRVLEAFLAASRAGDFEALLAVLDPDVVMRVDFGAAGASRLILGAQAVLKAATAYRDFALFTRIVLVNGAPGIITIPESGEPFSLADITVSNGRIVEINMLADLERLRAIAHMF